MAARPGDVRVGCSGWSYDSWRGRLYPQRLPRRRWLEHYAGTFDTVEVNATFYRLPAMATVAAWAEQVPPGFIFAIKASRYLTHIRRLSDVADGWARLRERLEPLAQANMLGPILWQLPQTFARDDRRLAELLALDGDECHAIEFRSADWLDPQVLDTLRRHRVALAVGDEPHRPLPVHPPVAKTAYLRLHRGRRGRRGNYSRAELREWAAVIDGWRTHAARTFVYLNNDWEGFAVRNALELRRLVRLAR